MGIMPANMTIIQTASADIHTHEIDHRSQLHQPYV